MAGNGTVLSGGDLPHSVRLTTADEDAFMRRIAPPQVRLALFARLGGRVQAGPRNDHRAQRRHQIREMRILRGPRDFYEGEVAAMISGDLEAGGSKIRKSDLAKFQPRWQAPLKGSYRNFEVNAVPIS